MADAPLAVTIELARTTEIDDPFAFAEGKQDYVVRLEGASFRQVSLDWGPKLYEALAEVRLPRRDPAVVAELGTVLRRFLAEADWSNTEEEIEAAVTEGRSVILTIRSAAAELFALPFELVSVRATGQHLGEIPGVVLRYAWPETATTAESPAPRLDDGRILVAWSASGGAVPAGDHIRAITTAATLGGLELVPERDVLKNADLRALAKALADPNAPPVSVLHLLAHGARSGSVYGLTLDDGEGGREHIDPGELRQLLAPHAGHLRLVVLSACDSSNSGATGNVLGSLAQAIHRAGIQAVLASRFPLSAEGSRRLTRRLYHELLVRPSSLEDAVRAARAELSTLPDQLDWAAVQLYARPEDGNDTRPVIIRPYRGLLPFGPEHTRFFFGRDGERRELADDIAELDRQQQPRFLIVAGASGTGKSSVVLSGTVPDLTGRTTADPFEDRESTDTKELVRTVERLEALVPRYDTPTMRQGVSLLRRLAGDLATGGHTMDHAVIKPGTDPDGALGRALTGRGESARPLLLVVDQFEELFTHGHEPSVRDGFCQKLWALASGAARVYVVCTIRVDFIGHCGQIVLDAGGKRLDQVAYDDAHRVFIAQMAKAQLRECIERPALKVGLRLQPGLAERLLEDVRAEPGALPLVSYTLDLLWQRRSPQGELTAAAYEALGGIAGAIEKKANEAYDGLDEEGQRFARRLLVRLVGASESGARDTRRRVRLDRVRPADDGQARIFDAVLARFVDERLLVRGEESGAATLEVAHEALIRKWERLGQWVEADRELLAELDEVERFLVPWREYGTLLTGDQLAYARRVCDRFPQDVSAEIRALVAASTQARVRRARRRQLIVAAVMVTIAGFGIWGWVNATNARANAELAIAEKEKAEHAQAEALEASALRLAASVRAEAAKERAEEAQVVAETARARTVREIVELSWIAASYHEPEADMVTGIRDLASHLSPIVDLAKIQSLTDIPVFLAGPHTSRPNLNASDFGHYNPKFVRWATENLIPAAKDPVFREKSRAVYVRYLEEMTRIYWRVGTDLAKDEALLRRLAAEYGAVIDRWKGEDSEAGTNARFEHLYRATYSYAEAVGRGEAWMTNNAPYHAGVAMGFWMRRELDGSRAEFMTMIEALLETYDHELLEQREPSMGVLARLRSALVGEWVAIDGTGVEPLLLRDDGFWRQGERSGTWSVADLDGDVIVRVDEGKVAIGIECCEQGITVREGGDIVAWRYRR